MLIFDTGICGDGISMAEKALRARPDLKIIILTASDNEKDVVDALRIGVHGYILKQVSAPELLKAIDVVRLGEPYITPSLASRLLIGTKGKSLLADQAGDKLGLTQRDRRVLRHLAKGLSNRELASVLGVKVRTAKYYLSQLFKKMQVQGRVDAILKAQKMNLAAAIRVKRKTEFARFAQPQSIRRVPVHPLHMGHRLGCVPQLPHRRRRHDCPKGHSSAAFRPAASDLIPASQGRPPED